ncbi:MFS transporter [Marinobacterium nitratireducens]|uniref:MFS transporter n=1 Tax=Marinobacterium nitratireducens TaxID=518897 RepID=A0A917Z8Q2_9GAMM|nr:MFS transporter [Marinobacterium nitratireducens]GGO78082.1 MFS transporter [Marinobacterium nitratireducens]
MHNNNNKATAFSSSDFNRYFAASAFLTLATWMTRFLIGWITWDLTQSALWVGVASALMLVPTLFLSPFFGVLADRVNARNGMLLVHLSEALLTLATALATRYGYFSLHWLLLLALLLGTLSAAQHPLRLVLLPKLVPRELFPSAIGLASTTYNASRVLGPALAAWLLLVAGIAGAFFVVAALFLAGLPLIRRIRLAPQQRAATQLPVWQALLQGCRMAMQVPLIRVVLLLTMVDGLLGRSIMELLPAISGALIDGDAATLAKLTAVAGLGSILGGVLVSRVRGREERVLRLILMALLGCSVVLLPVLAVRDLTGLGLVIMLLSLAVTVIGTGCQALIQLCIGDEYRGRVLSIWTVVSLGMPALGAFVLGASADVLGFRPVLVCVAFLGMLSVLAIYHQTQR